MSEHYEYDRESDLLDVWFGEKRAAWTVELTDNITISIDRRTGVPVALSFLDFTELVRATPFGPRSFPITGLDDLPAVERKLVLRAVTSPPVNTWLDVSSVERPPESPFAVAHWSPLLLKSWGCWPLEVGLGHGHASVLPKEPAVMQVLT